MRNIDMLVVHCSDTPASMDIGAEEIDQWHKERGWSGIGYHYVIRRDGTLEPGRPLEKSGAHVRGFNRNSIGICLVGGKGGFNFTAHQIDSLRSLIHRLRTQFPGAAVLGHRDLDAGKECPQFSLVQLLKGL